MAGACRETRPGRVLLHYVRRDRREPLCERCFDNARGDTNSIKWTGHSVGHKLGTGRRIRRRRRRGAKKGGLDRDYGEGYAHLSSYLLFGAGHRCGEFS